VRRLGADRIGKFVQVTALRDGRIERFYVQLSERRG
jgi:hypothetical protein